ncbi:MAG: hypothetical protein JST11_15735 [Acidobacteria bacterium]|nr:hypothetical protein [Acidobacteriota bacterium]
MNIPFLTFDKDFGELVFRRGQVDSPALYNRVTADVHPPVQQSPADILDGVVYLFPDLSDTGDAQYACGGASRDSVIPLFCVGAILAPYAHCKRRIHSDTI